jgi:hypothetical protein
MEEARERAMCLFSAVCAVAEKEEKDCLVSGKILRAAAHRRHYLESV